MKNTTGHPTTISFKCSPLMLESMNHVMITRYLDRSSVIRLALYLLDSYMSQEEIAQGDLFLLVEKMEKICPNQEHSFSEFCGFNN
ncbi:MAG: hypothetical protein R3Y56_04220 [Akkermansia sp.]